MNQTIVKIYDKRNDIFGFPQKYKEVIFYPIKISEYNIYEKIYQTLGIPKNYIPDSRILKMSYLKYVLYVVQSNINPGGNDIQESLLEILQHCCKTMNVDILWYMPEEKNDLDSLSLKIKIDNTIFDEWEFDNVREIILSQCGIDINYIEEFNPELEERLSVFQNHQDDIEFEDEIFVFSVMMKKTLNEFKDYTIFQFKKTLERLVTVEDFELYKPLEVTGQIKMQNGSEIKHYISHIPKMGRYHSILIETDKFMEESGINNPESNVKIEG